MKDILAYIPQRPPMVMVSKLLQSNEELTQTELVVKADNMFIKNGRLSASGLTENMAQTAAARAGYLFMEKNEAPKLGFIGAVKNLKIYQTPEVGAILKTEVRELGMMMNISSVKMEVKENENLIAECEMKIFIQP